MSGPNAPPMARMPPAGQTRKPMGADRVPMSNEVPRAPPGLMAQVLANKMSNTGSMWEGQGAPTPRDIARVRAVPTDTMVESFDATFGDGATAKALGGPEPRFAPSTASGVGYLPPTRGRPSNAPQTVNRSAKGDPAVMMVDQTIDNAGKKPPSAPPKPAPGPEAEPQEGED